jgi:hypothetical protein
MLKQLKDEQEAINATIEALEALARKQDSISRRKKGNTDKLSKSRENRRVGRSE